MQQRETNIQWYATFIPSCSPPMVCQPTMPVCMISAALEPLGLLLSYRCLQKLLYTTLPSTAAVCGYAASARSCTVLLQDTAFSADLMGFVQQLQHSFNSSIGASGCDKSHCSASFYFISDRLPGLFPRTILATLVGYICVPVCTPCFKHLPVGLVIPTLFLRVIVALCDNT